MLCSLLVAWWLRFDFSLPYRTILFSAAPLLVAIRIATLTSFGLLRGWWKYAGVRDGLNILKAVTSGSVIFWVIMQPILHVTAFPRSIYLLEAFLTTSLLVGVRLLCRIFAESARESISSGKRVVLIGAGSAAQTILREIGRADSGYVAVGCLDDNESKHGVRIHDVPVLGTPRLVALCEQAACSAVEGRMAPGTTTVGMRVQFDHMAPTAVGDVVSAEATLERVEGRRLTFTVSASDNGGLVGAGKMTRVVVELERFLKKSR